MQLSHVLLFVVYINGQLYFVCKDILAHSLALTKFCLAHISTTIPQVCVECSG